MQNFLTNTTHNVAWFVKRHNDGELELRAPFQRNPVWTSRQKGYLIDTILRGFPVPELYMQEFTDAEGNDRYVVVDGQQRLRACLEFIAGKVTLDPDDSADFADMSFEDLNDAQRKQIYNYNFVVRVLPEMPEADLRAMFQRLNRNVVALNSQELRHATYWGEFITSVESLASDERWALCRVFTTNDIRRMLDIEYVGELVIGHLHGLQNKKQALDDWYQAYEREFPQRREVEVVFGKTLGEILAVIPEIGNTRWRKKSDFYTLFLFLARYAAGMPFSRDGRSEVRHKLLNFGERVDEYIAEPATVDLPPEVATYARAVERAASDLANRKERERQLDILLGNTIRADLASTT